MKDHYADRIRKIIDSAPLPEFNHIYFNAASGRLTELEDAVESLPYMSDIKLIEIVDLDIAKLNESELEVYSRVFSDMQDYLIILIILRSSDKVEEKLSKESGLSNFVKLVESYGLIVTFETEKADKLTTWVAKHFNSKGVRFEANVPREIISVCGSDMYILQSEIEKLVLAFADKTITASDVRKYCCANSYYKYYDLTDALKRRDIVTAMKVWESLDIKREDLSKAIGFIAKVFADILFIKQGIDSGKSIETIAKEHKIKQWLVKKIAT
jgi:DNA polymerase III delta subunit